MTPLNKDESWSSVHRLFGHSSAAGLTTGAAAVGVSTAGVSTSIVSSSRAGVGVATAETLLRAFFLGGMIGVFVCV